MPSADTSNSAVRSGSLELFLQLASLKGSMARKRQLGHQKLWASPWYFLSFQKNCNGWNPTLELKWNHNMLIWPYACHLFERMLARMFSQKQLFCHWICQEFIRIWLYTIIFQNHSNGVLNNICIHWRGHVDTYRQKLSWLKPFSQAKQRFFEVKDHRAAPGALLQAYLWFSSLQGRTPLQLSISVGSNWTGWTHVNTYYKIAMRVTGVTGDKARPFQSKTRAAQNSEAQWHSIEPRHRRPLQPTWLVCELPGLMRWLYGTV